MPPPSGAQYLAHVADGGGRTMRIVLINPAAALLTGQVQFTATGADRAVAPVVLKCRPDEQTLRLFGAAAPELPKTIGESPPFDEANVSNTS